MRRVVGGVLVLVVFLWGLGFAQRGTSGAPGTVIQLAQPTSAAPEGFLANEAGISIYVDIGHPIDIEVAKGLLQGVETETADYVIGVLAMDNYDETQWPHVYANSAGWVIVYYSKDDPAAKIMAWRDYNDGVLDTTLLEIALRRYVQNLSRGMRVPLDISGMQVNYFDFRYPTASKLLLVVDTTSDGADTFRYKIPTELMIFEGSWMHFMKRGNYIDWAGTSLSVDNVQLDSLGGSGNHYSTGLLPLEQLSPESDHIVTVDSSSWTLWAGVAIVFIYG